MELNTDLSFITKYPNAVKDYTMDLLAGVELAQAVKKIKRCGGHSGAATPFGDHRKGEGRLE